MRRPGGWGRGGEGRAQGPILEYCLSLSFHIFPVTIALLAEDGHLVKLEEEVTQVPPMACSLLQEQGTYVLVQAISKWDPRLSFAAVLHYKGGSGP